MKHRLLLFLLFCLFAGANAQTSYDVDTTNFCVTICKLEDSILMKEFTGVKIDKTNLLTYQNIGKDFELMKPEKYRIKNWKGNKGYNYGIREHDMFDSTMWLYFQIENKTGDSLHCIFNKYGCDHIFLYEMTGRTVNVYENGTLAWLQNRNDKVNPNIIHLHLAPDEKKSYYLKVRNVNTRELFLAQIALQTPKMELQLRIEEINRSQVNYYTKWGYILIFLFVSFFVFLQYIELKEKAYLYYAIYAFLVTLFYFRMFYKDSYSGMWHPLLGPLYYLLEPIAALSMWGSYIYFVILFIDEKKEKFFTAWKIAKGLLFFALLDILVSYLYTYPILGQSMGKRIFEKTLYVFMFFGFFALITVFYDCYQAIKKEEGKFSWRTYWHDYRLVFYASMGAGLLILISFIGVTFKERVWGYGLTYTPIQFGLLIDLFFFSLAIGWRTGYINDAKLKAEKTVYEGQLLLANLKAEKAEAEKSLAEEKLKRIKLLADAEKKQLSLQLQLITGQELPRHLLSNSLTLLRNWINIGAKEKVDKYLNDFPTFLRAILPKLVHISHNLKEELEMCRLYLEVESLGLENFSYQISVAEEIDKQDVILPTLMLQPILENAIKHGLQPKSGEKKLLIEVLTHEKGVLIRVEDNGIGRREKSEAEKNKHTSMGNKRLGIERLENFETLTGIKIEMEIRDKKEENVPTGTIVAFLVHLE